ncbi:nitrate reductase molybdenum cofactor assembly chaperone [Parvibium lacunae]|uniref:Nitrate reductase molybdenum cofactor assembly chaperone n=1 Tax=Parvibium lacunae TaxID=1888893 RepID=A0A368L7C5_9BURK|nr:nitrate reductase molybdenum cofactor assembly chaperone [Parvibium lacunae]RCS59411.1 nitrate reductase molybdenum cofactor assembly chaperone [Parvibium lacunae]
MTHTISSTLRVLSALLSYPEEGLLAALPEVPSRLGNMQYTTLQPLLNFMQAHSLIELQENYVATFDRNPAHSLHLFEHIHGESRDRGQAMVDLLNEYQTHGYEPHAAELPDHVPLFLEFLSLVPTQEAETLLGDAIHVLAAIGERLERNASPYAGVFKVLRSLTTVVPQALTMPPIKDMDEALEKFGPDSMGVEPLLKPGCESTNTPQPIQFYPAASRMTTAM